MMNGRGKSDSPIVSGKPPNSAKELALDAVEGRGLAKGERREQNALRTQSRTVASSELEPLRQAARKDRKKRFTALLHHIYDVERLRRAYLCMKRASTA